MHLRKTEIKLGEHFCHKSAHFCILSVPFCGSLWDTAFSAQGQKNSTINSLFRSCLSSVTSQVKGLALYQEKIMLLALSGVEESPINTPEKMPATSVFPWGEWPAHRAGFHSAVHCGLGEEQGPGDRCVGWNQVLLAAKLNSSVNLWNRGWWE